MDFADDLHHDVARWGSYTYLLHDYPYAPAGGIRVDGILVDDRRDAPWLRVATAASGETAGSVRPCRC